MNHLFYLALSIFSSSYGRGEFLVASRLISMSICFTSLNLNFARSWTILIMPSKVLDVIYWTLFVFLNLFFLTVTFFSMIKFWISLGFGYIFLASAIYDHMNSWERMSFLALGWTLNLCIIVTYLASSGSIL